MKDQKMAIVGDTGQIDLKQKKDSGLFFMSRAVTTVSGVVSIHLKTNQQTSYSWTYTWKFIKQLKRIKIN